MVTYLNFLNADLIYYFISYLVHFIQIIEFKYIDLSLIDSDPALRVCDRIGGKIVNKGNHFI